MPMLACDMKGDSTIVQCVLVYHFSVTIAAPVENGLYGACGPNAAGKMNGSHCLSAETTDYRRE
jgi:hypothetical protein